ncbi:GH39 family glycosyl hydrolase [Eubacterium xylanophilum]|uniref:GH39 family glycosyl hydrolase n=1 Tax=Eubacterium xylanophilum TaxID=39497 RepID=UPI00047DB264|nr:glycosyl hydrolase [Eubacterium xylanophilum]
MITINPANEVKFNNNVDYCVGTGRLGLALTDEYLRQLKFVQEEIGFKFIRGHGLFSDDVAIYQEYEEDGETRVEYNYTYVDRIFDKYLELGIRPYIELGFMPEKLASGTQTIFYWKGNTTPPKDYKKWTDMVVALLAHLRGRYGEEVLEWPIEVWNEPNLPGFWYEADMKEYFKLFKETFVAIKNYDERFKVGGPAVCGVKEDVWITEFLKFCRENGLHPDIITRHHYTVEFPESVGHAEYSKLEDAEMRFDNLQSSRDIVDSFEEYKDVPIHITEFSTSYTPHGVIHDTNLNAAYMAEQLSRIGDMNEMYSYWTFGDVFEEKGVPFSLFHGGFGMVAAGNIPKPTFWTFVFYKKLKDCAKKCVHRDKTSVVVETENGYAGILWNIDGDAVKCSIEIPTEISEFSYIQKIVDEETCNPLKVWHDLGEPANPTGEQTKLIRESAYPLTKSDILTTKDGKVLIEADVKKNSVIYFEINKRDFTPDRGYDYEKVLTFH